MDPPQFRTHVCSSVCLLLTLNYSSVCDLPPYYVEKSGGRIVEFGTMSHNMVPCDMAVCHTTWCLVIWFLRKFHLSNWIIVEQDVTVFSLLHICRQLYIFRVLTPIIRSWYNCNHSFWHWSTGSTIIRSRCWVPTQQQERTVVVVGVVVVVVIVIVVIVVIVVLLNRIYYHPLSLLSWNWTTRADGSSSSSSQPVLLPSALVIEFQLNNDSGC